MMNWYQEEEDDEEDLMFSPALLARRASESWIIAPPVEVNTDVSLHFISFEAETQLKSNNHKKSSLTEIGIY